MTRRGEGGSGLSDRVKILPVVRKKGVTVVLCRNDKWKKMREGGVELGRDWDSKTGWWVGAIVVERGVRVNSNCWC